MTGQTLTIALVLADPTAPPAWIVRLVDEIDRDDHLSLCAVIGPDPPRRRRPANKTYSLVHRLEAALAARRPPVDIAAWQSLTEGQPILTAECDEDLAALAPDILLDLSGNHGLTVSASTARHGVWFTDATSTVPGAPGIRPLVEDSPVSTIQLFRRTGQQPVPSLVARAAVDGKFIAARNAWFLEEKSVGLILRELRRCARDGRARKGSEGALFVPPVAPTHAELAEYLPRMVLRLVERGIEAVAQKLRMRPGMFHLRIEQEDSLVLFSPEHGEATRPQDNSYFADPFLVERDGESWCLFERYDYATRHGAIWAGRVDGDRVTDIQPAIDPGYHLSFPFPIEHQGELFVMPESCAKRRLEVWRCTGFPDRWELHATALEGTMVADSALLEVDGEWWIFANVSTDPFGDVSSELHLYRTSGPDLAWVEPHRLNPVVFDSRMARNAGRIHRIGDALYRPAQDNSHGTYGYGLQIMRIESMSDTDYRERSTRHVRPGFAPGVIGIHHIDRLGDKVIFDVRERMGGMA